MTVPRRRTLQRAKLLRQTLALLLLLPRFVANEGILSQTMNFYFTSNNFARKMVSITVTRNQPNHGGTPPK